MKYSIILMLAMLASCAGTSEIDALYSYCGGQENTKVLVIDAPRDQAYVICNNMRKIVVKL